MCAVFFPTRLRPVNFELPSTLRHCQSCISRYGVGHKFLLSPKQVLAVGISACLDHLCIHLCIHGAKHRTQRDEVVRKRTLRLDEYMLQRTLLQYQSFARAAPCASAPALARPGCARRGGVGGGGGGRVPGHGLGERAGAGAALWAGSVHGGEATDIVWNSCQSA